MWEEFVGLTSGGRESVFGETPVGKTIEFIIRKNIFRRQSSEKDGYATIGMCL